MNNEQYNDLKKAEIPAGQLKEAAVAAWLDEIGSAKKREKRWREEGKKIVKVYEGDRSDYAPFNILFSNTDTLAPALYNNTPRPAIQRRHKDKDPLGAAVALTLNRTLSYSMDSNSGDTCEFDTLIEHGILQALVPGRGIIRWKYQAELKQNVGVKAEAKQSPEAIEQTGAEGNAGQQTFETVENERIVGVPVEWDRWTCGYAKKWHQVPWVSFEHHMTKEELKENFGVLGQYVSCGQLEDDDGKASDNNRKVAVVYEIWNREKKTVIFVSPGLKERELKMVDDPLELTGFFPMDEPLTFLQKVGDLVPQPVYQIYREQAEELNEVTVRITAIVKALKVRGAYDSSLTELSKVLQADDNVLVPIENVMALGEGAKLENALFLMPIDKLVSVLQQLYLQRTQIKQVIYEITGISDILRGSSVASETATAQNIKNQWGTLRLKKMQKKVQKWCRNNLRIMAEIACRRFAVKTFQAVTELPYVTQEQKAQAQVQLQQMQIQQSQQAMMAPPGQPPAPPEPPPQELTDLLATPSWEDILDLMRSGLNTTFRVDIELNSTIADDMAEDQKDVGEMLNALSQFLNGVAPLIENGTMPFEVAKAMMLGIVRKLKVGPEVEEHLDKMKPPTPPEPEKPQEDPNIQLKMQAAQAAAQLAVQKAQQEMQMMQMEMEMRKEEHRIKMEELRQKAQVGQAKFEQAMLMARMKAFQPTKQPATSEN